MPLNQFKYDLATKGVDSENPDLDGVAKVKGTIELAAFNNMLFFIVVVIIVLERI